MRKLFTICLLFLSASTFSQSNCEPSRRTLIDIETGYGVTMLFNDMIQENMRVGVKYDLGLLYNAKKGRVSIGPLYSFRGYRKVVDTSTNATMKLHMNEFGVKTKYNIYTSANKKIRLESILQLKYSLISDKVSVKLYSPYRMKAIKESVTILTGNNVSFDLGYQLIAGVFCLSMGFDILESDVTVYPDTRDKYITRMMLNSFYAKAGLSIPILID